MREIIFRGKRVGDGKFVTGDLIHGQGPKYGRIYILPHQPIMPTGCHDLDGWEVTPESVGQYTGLKDSLNKMIFEGDVVFIETKIDISRTFGDVDIRDQQIKCKVVWDRKMASFDLETIAEDEHLKNYDFYNAFNGSDDTLVEIIGNIHENETRE